MPRYINADALTAELNDMDGMIYRDLADILAAVPSADVAPVKRGRWIQQKTAIGKIYSVCSSCKMEFKFQTDKGTLARLDMDGLNFCPYCGAMMEGMS